MAAGSSPIVVQKSSKIFSAKIRLNVKRCVNVSRAGGNHGLKFASKAVDWGWTSGRGVTSASSFEATNMIGI